MKTVCFGKGIQSRINIRKLLLINPKQSCSQSDVNVFSLLLIKYSIEGTKVTASEVLFSPIEFLDWKCLTVGALGWGQIQIANSNNIHVIDQYSRKKWMLQLCEVMIEFYPREIGKIMDRIDRFNSVKEYWKSKEDIWEA